ncbi:uncharacterized protein LOC131664919 [Phymastichus coffea]|uniref:uncharacterized protein LOC131664919 n=1 Tax=Phymastichus coffea TaxID=108790 RepID=UPI00273C38A1|nr:uncharacterized protein LOC131664919 [Phymastichus coffea]
MKDYKSQHSCKVCSGKHHSLLHYNNRNNDQQEADSNNSAKIKANVAHVAIKPVLASNTCQSGERNILLATAQVIVIESDGQHTRARVLLDQGSEATFISEALVQSLRLSKSRVETNVIGVRGCNAGCIKSATCFTLQSQVDPSFKLEVNAFVLPRLTSALPSRNFVKFNLHQFQQISLADPEFHRSSRVDIMIGADLYGQLLRSGVQSFPRILAVAQNTALGWVVSGPTHDSTSRRAVPINHAIIKALRCEVNDDLSEIIQKFWTIEEVPITTNFQKSADKECERLFADTHTRERDGHLKVRLPCIGKLPSIGAATRHIALGSLKHQHRRFLNDSKLANAYAEFMDTYLKLGHMERVPTTEINNPQAWYLPHHAVITHTSRQSKIRVVFDASRKTHDKQCLNDFFIAGPPHQNDLFLILLNWRRYRYAFTADIIKMFR